MLQKRRFIRIPTKTIGRVVINNDNYYGIIDNISAGGLYIRLDKNINKLNPKNIIKIQFNIFNNLYNLNGIIVRKDNLNGVGIQFVFDNIMHQKLLNEKIVGYYLKT